MEDKRSERINLPLTPDERKIITAAAKLTGLTPATFTRTEAVKAARAIIKGN